MSRGSLKLVKLMAVGGLVFWRIILQSRLSSPRNILKQKYEKKSGFFVGKFRKLSKFVIVNLIRTTECKCEIKERVRLLFDVWGLDHIQLTETDFCKCFYIQLSELIRHLLKYFSFSDLLLDQLFIVWIHLLNVNNCILMSLFTCQ